MLVKKITYTDYLGNERTEEFCFNLSRAELTMMENSELGGMKRRLERIVQTQDTVEIMRVFHDLIHRSYGEISPDGKRFVKSEELANAFEQTEAYSELIMEILTDEKFAETFTREIMPAQIMSKVDEIKAAEMKAGLKAIEK